MSKSVSQLTEKTDQEADDLFHIVRGGIDYKQKRSTILPLKKTYKAIITQAGTAAPTVVVLENSVGAIVWSYDSVGAYVGTLSGAFLANKVFIHSMDYKHNAEIDAFRSSDNEIEINTYDATDTLANGLLTDAPIFIEVYP